MLEFPVVNNNPFNDKYIRHRNTFLMLLVNFAEGLRERDKSSIGSHLKTISFLKDNTYVLNRHIWNDVHEDWPFYTEQDRQSLKRFAHIYWTLLTFLISSNLLTFVNSFIFRRKPQNLTPPLSSDGGSSTSGQSPTSTHNGSPPPAVKRPPLNNDKYSDNGPTSKKQRISHFKKDVNHDNTRYTFFFVCWF